MIHSIFHISISEKAALKFDDLNILSKCKIKSFEQSSNYKQIIDSDDEIL